MRSISLCRVKRRCKWQDLRTKIVAEKKRVKTDNICIRASIAQTAVATVLSIKIV